jgi:hypothetical protein
MLRPYFLHHRELLGHLCRLSYETVHELVTAAAGEPVQPGFIAVIQTFASDLKWNPHCHGLASRGGWTAEGRWVPVPHVDSRAAELLFRHKVLRLLLKTGLLPEERAAVLLSWRHHTGFSVHNQTRVSADEYQALERLARYLLRPAVSLERLDFDKELGEVRYRQKADHDPLEDQNGHQVEERFDPLEFVARVVVQIPQPRLHEVRYYGYYSSVMRGRRREAQSADTPASVSTPESSDHEPARNSASRRRWAELIRRIYHSDPLICQNCGESMTIVSFITERPVILRILRHLESLVSAERAPPPIH